MNLITKRYVHENLVVAGTGAGSMALADLMIYPGMDPNDPGKNIPVYDGLSLINNVIIDTHFLVRNRFRRLAVAVANHRDHIGIGLEEDTGIMIKEGVQIEAIGSGLVTIFDARTLQQSNPDVYIQNLLVHILSYGNRFQLNQFYEI